LELLVTGAWSETLSVSCCDYDCVVCVVCCTAVVACTCVLAVACQYTLQVGVQCECSEVK
jgi:hypothetical protein